MKNTKRLFACLVASMVMLLVLDAELCNSHSHTVCALSILFSSSVLPVSSISDRKPISSRLRMCVLGIICLTSDNLCVLLDAKTSVIVIIMNACAYKTLQNYNFFCICANFVVPLRQISIFLHYETSIIFINVCIPYVYYSCSSAGERHIR